MSCSWIDVKESLPGNGEDVLVAYMYGGKFEMRTGFYDTRDKFWKTDTFSLFPGDAVYWMALPEPPEIKKKRRKKNA